MEGKQVEVNTDRREENLKNIDDSKIKIKYSEVDLLGVFLLL